MINRQFAISAVVMFIMAYAIGFLVHGMLLQADYAKLGNLDAADVGDDVEIAVSCGRACFVRAWLHLDLSEGAREEAMADAGRALWHRDRGADDNSDLSDLSRRCAVPDSIS